MSNPNKVEIIRKNIQVSTLLSDHEKADWLNLLDLMNDKQLGELEEILIAEPQQPKPSVNSAPASMSAPAQTPAQPFVQAPLSTPMQNMPPLSHIANVPTGVNMSRVSPGPLPPYQGQARPQPRPAASQPAAPAPVQTASLAVATPRPAALTVPPKTNFLPLSVRPTPSPNLSAPIAPTVPQPQAAQPRPIAQAPTAPQPRPKPAAQQPAAIQPQSQPKAPGAYQVEEIEELQNLSLQTLRDFTHQSITNTIRSAITEHGYFAILQLIEASPLYSSYIAAGKERLGMRSASGAVIQAGLTQEEFEFMVDLLRNMRFNRW